MFFKKVFNGVHMAVWCFNML